MLGMIVGFHRFDCEFVVSFVHQNSAKSVDSGFPRIHNRLGRLVGTGVPCWIKELSLAISHSTNAVISPAIEYDNDTTIYPNIPIHPHVRLHVSKANAVALRGLTFSSDDAVLQAKFAQGCDNATQFLRRHNLLNRSHHVVS